MQLAFNIPAVGEEFQRMDRGAIASAVTLEEVFKVMLQGGWLDKY